MTAPLPPDPADVTEGDRERAEEIAGWPAKNWTELRDAIAAALAAERAAVARPVLALAEEWEQSHDWADAAARLRRALAGPDDTQQDGAR